MGVSSAVTSQEALGDFSPPGFIQKLPVGSGFLLGFPMIALLTILGDMFLL